MIYAIAAISLFLFVVLLAVCRGFAMQGFAMQGEVREAYEQRLLEKYSGALSHEMKAAA